MSYLSLESPHHVKPSNPKLIHPKPNGLKFLWACTNGPHVDLVQGLKGVSTNGQIITDVTSHKHGKAWNPTAADPRINFGDPGLTSRPANLTAIAVGEFDLSGTWSSALGYSTAAGNSQFTFHIEQWPGTNVVGCNMDGTDYNSTLATPQGFGFLAVSFDGSTLHFNVNGQTNNVSASWGSGTTWDTFCLGSEARSGGFEDDMLTTESLYLVAYFERTLSPGEIEYIRTHVHEYFFEPEQSFLFVSASADGAHSIIASAAATMEGASTVDSDASISATATVTMAGASVVEADYSVGANGQLDWVGESTAVTEGDFSADTNSLVTMEGASTADTDVDINSQAVLTIEGEATTEADATVIGAGVVTFEGSSAAEGQGAINANSTSSITMEGKSTHDGDVSIGATGLLFVEGEATAEGEANIDGTGTVSFSSEAEEAETPEIIPEITGGGGWSRENLLRKKRDLKKLRQDQDFMDLIALALPQILNAMALGNYQYSE